MHACPICLGLPGILPALNKEAVEDAVMTALVTRHHISPESGFVRKHYFYPDLSNGYQISQHESSLAVEDCSVTPSVLAELIKTIKG
jgi:aspartyl-tRNA(Asn)/glutamyl-tRNA(Gln) amidotransferase subunit B